MSSSFRGIPLRHVESSRLLVKQESDPNIVKEIFDRYKAASWRGSVNLLASILGTAVLTMPHAAKTTGILFFIIFNIIATIVAHTTASFLVLTVKFLNKGIESQSTDEARYAGLALEVFGKSGQKFVQYGLLLQQLGSCVGYVVVIGDVFDPLMTLLFKKGISKLVVQNLFAWLLMFPLTAFLKNLTKLRYASAAAVFSIFFFSFTVIFNGLYVLTNEDPNMIRDELLIEDNVKSLIGPFWLPKDFFSFLRGIPLICYAYDMHFNVIPIHEDLKGDVFLPFKTEEVFIEASMKSFSIASLITIATGLTGYLTFLSSTEPDILSNFAVNGNYISIIMDCVRSLYGVGLALGFPLIVWELRSVLFMVTWNSLDQSDFRFVFVTFLIVGVTCLLAGTADNIATVFALVGTTITPTLDFFFPSLLYLQSGAALDNKDSIKPKLILFGTIVIIPIGLGIWCFDRGFV